MNAIRLWDNGNHCSGTFIKDSVDVDVHHIWSILSKYDGMNLAQLHKRHLIVFPPTHDIKEADNDNVFYKICNVTRDPDDKVTSFVLNTSNLMGVIRLPDKLKNGGRLQIEVHSRFDKGKQFFLNYLLSKVAFDVNFTDIVDATESSMWEVLLALALLRRFTEAAQIGLFRRYHGFEYNDLNFKGKFDFDRHLKLNYPLGGKIAYSRREITFDNAVNHLLRHAVAKIERSWPSLLSLHGDSEELMRQLKLHTPTWNSGDLDKTLAHKDVRGELTHPFFAEHYEELRRLSRALLLGDGAGLYDRTEDFVVEGVIFDGSWLWEEYISTLLVPLGYIHAKTDDKRTGISVLDAVSTTFFPDFRLPVPGTGKCSVVLDTKYKKSDSWQPGDIHQVFSYMFLTGADIGGLICPPHDNPKDSCVKIKQFTCLDDKKWQCFNYDIPNDASVADFIISMEANEHRLQKFARQ